jgi:pimeloyl-ACP methyl ester carboxylesterase
MEPAKIRRTYVNGPFGQMHLRLAGGGKAHRPLICFHLSPLSGVIYETWLGEMGKDRLAVAPDTPGYGMSDHPPAPPTIRDYAQAMAEAIDSLDLNEVDVMGYHTGSKICVELARLQKRRVKHLILVSAPVYTAADLAQQQVDNAAPDAALDGSHLIAQWNAFTRFRGPGQTPEMIMRHFPDAIRGGARRRWGHGAAFAYTYPEHIGDVTAPILVLNPNDDLVRFTPRVLPYLKNGRLLELPDWGHGFIDLHTAEAAALIRPFLDDDRWPEGSKAP